MSWYSLTVNGKFFWDSYSSIAGVLTGGVIGKLVMENGVKKMASYELAREKISLYLATYFCEKLTPYNKAMATTLLEGSINQETMSIVKGALKERMLNVSREDLKWALRGSAVVLKNLTKNLTLETYNYFKQPALIKQLYHRWRQIPRQQLILADGPEGPQKTVTSEDVNKLVTYISSNYSEQDANILFNLLKELKFTEFGCKALILYLQPHSERAVKSAITSAAKTGIGMGIDFGVKKLITVATLPILYGLARGGLQLAVNQLPDTPWSETIANGTSYLPSISTVLWGSAAVHVGLMGYIFWRAIRQSSNAPGSDKKEIKELVLRLSKNSLMKKIDENPLFKTVGIEMESSTKERLATQLIEQAVDLHWPKLTRTKLMGIPLAV